MGQIEGLNLEYIVQRNYWIQSLHLRVKAFFMPLQKAFHQMVEDPSLSIYIILLHFMIV